MPVKNNDIRNKLKKLVHKDNIILFPSGNKALLQALKIARDKGKTKLLIQDQGGWITYKQFAKKLRLEIVEMKTDHGLLILDELQCLADEKSVLLYTSMTGYYAVQEAKNIYEKCNTKGCFVINDASGSIGRDEAIYGDIIVCSMGKGKPINHGTGGFLGDSLQQSYSDVEEWRISPEEKEQLYQHILNLPEHLQRYKKSTQQIKSDLKSSNILHPELDGINVIILYETEEEKQQIVSYCEIKGLEIELCPRNIRVLCNAVSIEVKRIP